MAIIRDSSTNGSDASSFSHTCSGTNRFLVVAVTIDKTSGTPPASCDVTYGGVAMTLHNTANHQDGSIFSKIHIFGLIAPATGSNTVAIGSVDGTINFCAAVSYTGVKQTGYLVETVTENDAAQNPTLAVNSGTRIAAAVGAISALPRAVTGVGSNTAEIVRDSPSSIFESSPLQMVPGAQFLNVTCSANTTNKSLVGVVFEQANLAGGLIMFD